MDYLISEGYPSAAEKFALEANIQLNVDADSIRDRVEIRNAIYGGDIQSAVEKINELNPQVSLVYLVQAFDSSTLNVPLHLAMIRYCSCTTHILLGVLMRNKPKLLQSSV